MRAILLDEYNGKEYFQCPECALHYETNEEARSCKKWCSSHKNCNVDITSSAIENQRALV